MRQNRIFCVNDAKTRLRLNTAEETDKSDDDISDSEDPVFKIEEVSSVKTAGKQLNAKIIFSDPEESYDTE